MTGELFDGRYQAKEVLGRGAFGVVYRGIDVTLGRQVAIKVLALEDAMMRQRFLREARILAALEHPNIVPIYAFGEREGSQYFVMRYVSGSTLSYANHAAGRTPEEVLALMAPIAQALDFAHAQDVVHRDLKPANICFTEHHVPTLLDFGIARGPDEKPMTQPGQTLGTPHYMAPEQAKSQPPTARSDQYALAVLLFELLTGQRPFDGSNPLTVLFNQVSEPPPAPRSLRPDLPEEMETALLRGLAKAPEDRFESCAALLEAMGYEYVDLPSMPKTGSFEPVPAPESAMPDIRVLVVEDEVTDVLILKRQLAGVDAAQFDVDHVLRLADLPARLLVRRPDVILLDLSLPDSEGLETLDRALELAGRLPIVVQTGDDDPLIARAALRRGAQDFVMKGRVNGQTLARAILFAHDRASRPPVTPMVGLFDEITGLPGLTLLLDRLKLALARARRDDTTVAVIKVQRDAQTPSPSALAEAGLRLRGALSQWETLAHLGDGQFVAVVESVDRADSEQMYVKWLRAALGEPQDGAGRWHFGMSFGPDESAEPSVLVDLASQRAIEAPLPG